jgi:hypothetical protein
MTGTGTAANLIKIASGEVGYHEGHNSSGWNNDQKYSDETPGFDWSDFQAWCDTFCAWNFWKAGISTEDAPRSASCDASMAAYKAMDRYSEYPAIGGQVFFGTPGDAQHTGLVMRYDADRIWTVEGNTNSTGSYQGDGVYAKVHERRDPRVLGYGYPNFSHPIVSADPKWQIKPPKPPIPDAEYVMVKGGHLSGQFGDPSPQQRHDANAIFKRARAHGILWFTGTEAGNPAIITALTAAAEMYHFRLSIKRESWIAVDRDFIKKGFAQHFVPVVESSEGHGRHSDRGIFYVEFDTENIGHVVLGTWHQLTDGREPGGPNYALNLRLMNAVDEWVREQGAETNLVFCGADQNDNDRVADTFKGAPLTSLADELHKYEDTHEGGGNAVIDVMASYDGDKRVEGKDLIVDDDSEFKLFTDHYLLVGTWRVRVLT